jgi:chorismate synthase
MIRFSTAGESHGEALIALVAGLPAGIPIDLEFVNHELWRRQQGYGRGGRMKIETDKAHVLSGIRHGKTIGSPIAIELINRDWKNWEEKLPIGPGDPAKHQAVTSPRPGHADLAGALKYNFPDARYILERSSARETTSRVAAGALAKLYLRALDIEVLSHVIRVGRASLDRPVAWEEIVALAARDEVVLGCVEEAAEARMKAEVEEAARTGDTVNGVFEVVAHGVPPGLGTHVNWDEKLDGLLAQSVMSIQAVKAVEIGRGVVAAQSFGSQVHDPILWATDPGHTPTRFQRPTNNAGGLEGGISNGEEIVVRGYLKPISTLRKPLASVSFNDRQPTSASYERSDVSVVPAAGVVGEAMVALTLAQAIQQKFGGDSLEELQRNFRGYIEQIRSY